MYAAAAALCLLGSIVPSAPICNLYCSIASLPALFRNKSTASIHVDCWHPEVREGAGLNVSIVSIIERLWAPPNGVFDLLCSPQRRGWLFQYSSSAQPPLVAADASADDLATPAGHDALRLACQTSLDLVRAPDEQEQATDEPRYFVVRTAQEQGWGIVHQGSSASPRPALPSPVSHPPLP